MYKGMKGEMPLTVWRSSHQGSSSGLASRYGQREVRCQDALNLLVVRLQEEARLGDARRVDEDVNLPLGLPAQRVRTLLEQWNSTTTIRYQTQKKKRTAMISFTPLSSFTTRYLCSPPFSTDSDPYSDCEERGGN